METGRNVRQIRRSVSDRVNSRGNKYYNAIVYIQALVRVAIFFLIFIRIYVVANVWAIKKIQFCKSTLFVEVYFILLFYFQQWFFKPFDVLLYFISSR